MDVNSISALNNAQFAQSYSIALQRKVMDNQELAAQELLQMLPQQPPVGEHLIDVLA